MSTFAAPMRFRRLALVAGVALLVAACRGPASPADPPAATQPDPPVATQPDPPVAATPPPLQQTVDTFASGTVEVLAGDGSRHEVAVRIASTPEERAHGLMHVPHLPDGVGMWFQFGEDLQNPFWMRNTLIPLDIAFVAADGRIVFIADAVPCEADPCLLYRPDGPYRTVLEVAAGSLSRMGVGVGDEVRLVGS